MRLKTACGCMTLSTGSIVVGFLSIISSIFFMIILSVIRNENDTKNVSKEDLMVLRHLYPIIMIYFPIDGICAGLMIFGCVRRKSEYVFPWVALGYAAIVGMVSGSAISIVRAASTMSVGGFCIFILGVAIGAVLQMYFWLIVYTLYRELLAEKYGHQAKPKSQGVMYSKPNYDV